MQKLEAQTKAYLKAGEREAAAKFALELQKAKKDLAANEQQLAMHEEAYGNNLKKIQHATKKLGEVREKIQKYDAELKMSAAEAEVAALAQSFNLDVTTDFGQIEQVIQGKIDKNRGKDARGRRSVAGRHRVDRGRRDDGEGRWPKMRCTQFEVELGLRSPETTKLADARQGPGAGRRGQETNRKQPAN